MLAPLRRRNFRLLFFGRAVSFGGSAMAPIALAFAVLELDGSATELGLVLSLAILPQIRHTYRTRYSPVFRRGTRSDRSC